METTTDFTTFSSRVREGCLAALTAEIPGDLLTPVSAYRALRGASTPSFLLESVEGDGRFARHSFIGLEAAAIVESRHGVVSVRAEGEAGAPAADVFEAIRSLIPRRRPHPDDRLPRLSRGVVGFVGYDEVRSLERLPSRAPDRTGAPDSLLGLFTSVVVFDHLTRRVRLVATADPSNGDPCRRLYEALRERLERMRRALASPSRDHAAPTFSSGAARFDLAPYPGLVRRALEHIRAGDIFQVVLSAGAEVPFEGDPFQVYRALRMINPSPYHFYFDFGETALLGSSPEMLARLTGETLEHVPIAGTRKRAETENEDAEVAAGLLADPKERSEHVMLVDLGRNDLSRVCRTGTVSVERMMEVERYSHVMHLVSLLRGSLRPGADAVDVLRALFPAGTVSGAPKIRAMQIVDDLEESRRGFYSGAAGYVDCTGSADFCLTIRSMLAHRKTLHLRAGAGIVAASDPVRERDEVRHKLGALFEALRIAGGLES